ncbi:YqgE/AlgH family protein [Tistrella mobilis]|jgi:putative transcriptional regulator|uniref:YqgE/AlgH family protein n=1 Tax=Tistrella mobilis TaxID=171437 RepID=UPI003558817A
MAAATTTPFEMSGPEGLTGKVLIAMPRLEDPWFTKTVIYLCAHSDDGAMGLVVNRVLDTVDFPELLSQLGLDCGPEVATVKVHFGGPVETGRGFVLHSTDYVLATSLRIDDEVALTATLDVLKAMTEGHGPDRTLVALGYAGWGPGQLETEIQSNSWLVVDADAELLFEGDVEGKWREAIGRLGVDLAHLSGEGGHA